METDLYHVDLTDPELTIPDDAPALLITAADDGADGEYTGTWLPVSQSWAQRGDGDVVAQVAFCYEQHDDPAAPGVHLALHLVHDGRRWPLGEWCGVQGHWPHVLRGPAATAMGLHTALEDAEAQCASVVETSAAL